MIESNPDIMMGKPVISGTRITVEYVLEALGSGQSIQDVLESHHTLTQEGILAALRYAAGVLKNEQSFPLHGKAA